MHIGMVGPLNLSILADKLDTGDAETVRSMPVRHGTAPSLLVRALLEAGHQVTVVTHLDARPSLSLSGPGLDVVVVESRKRARSRALNFWSREVKGMQRALSKAMPDVVHAHWAYEWALAADRTGLPWVLTVRDAPFTVVRYNPNLYRFIRLMLAIRVRLAARRSVTTAVSPYMASKWRSQTRWRGPISVTPNIAPSDFKRSNRVSASSGPVIVEVADAGKRKNVRNLLIAFGKLKAHLPDATLKVIGSGLADDEDVARWARSELLADRVSFLGELPRSEVGEQLRSATVHVHAALEETLGNTLLEAMSAGIPVVGGQRSGAVPWVLNGGKAGLLTDVEDPEKMALDIAGLLSDPLRQAEQVDRAKDWLDATFSKHAALNDALSAYEAAIDGWAVRGNK